MKKLSTKKVSLAIAGFLTPFALVVPSVSAATATWTGNVQNTGEFSQAYNWGGVVVVDGDTVVFPATAVVQLADNDATDIVLEKILFNGASTVPTSSKSFTVSGNGITLNSGIEAIMTGLGGDHQVLTDITLAADQTFKTTGSNSLTVGDANEVSQTTLDLDTYDLTLDASGGSISLVGELIGSGDIIKKGDGGVTFNFAKSESTGYAGSINVEEGEIKANGDFDTGNVTLSGGTLKGTGTIGYLTMNAGKVAPGLSPGVINTGNLVYTGGEQEVELGGTADGEYDQVNVVGTVDLGSATDLTISLHNDYEPEVNDAFFIIQNDGTDAVSGTFNGLANGDKVTLGSYTYQINYDAGDGNDVALLVTGTPSVPDTGVESVTKSPLAAFIALAASFGVLGGLRFADAKRK